MPSSLPKLFELEQWEIQEINDEVPIHLPNCTQYYVDVDGTNEQACEQADFDSSDEDGERVQRREHTTSDQVRVKNATTETEEGHTSVQDEGGDGHTAFSNFLQLPRVEIPPISKVVVEPQIDYHKSILLTAKDHVRELEDVAAKKE